MLDPTRLSIVQKLLGKDIQDIFHLLIYHFCFGDLKSVTSIPSLVELLEGRTPYCKAPIEVNYEPESGFDYSEAGFCIIQQLIEDVTEKPFYQVKFKSKPSHNPL